MSAFALWVSTLLLPGMNVTPGAQSNDTLAAVLTFLFLGALFALVNMVIKPLVSLLALPLTLLTLGLFALIINALMLALTSWLSQATPVKLTFDSFFWTAILAAIIISLLTTVGTRLLSPKRVNT